MSGDKIEDLNIKYPYFSDDDNAEEIEDSVSAECQGIFEMDEDGDGEAVVATPPQEEHVKPPEEAHVIPPEEEHANPPQKKHAKPLVVITPTKPVDGTIICHSSFFGNFKATMRGYVKSCCGRSFSESEDNSLSSGNT